ncbi:MAG TPA: hypothetical protein VEC37_11995, partial [Bacillota bacterium]|nr:hypothetical protein [Bacillota bacterium]
MRLVPKYVKMDKTVKMEVNTIKAKVRLIVGLISALIMLGILNLRQVLIIEVKYSICISGAVLLLYLAAVSFKISTKLQNIIIIKIWRLFSLALVFSSVTALLLLPFILARKEFQSYDQPVILFNLGIVLLLVFINELMSNLKKFRKK